MVTKPLVDIFSSMLTELIENNYKLDDAMESNEVIFESWVDELRDELRDQGVI